MKEGTCMKTIKGPAIFPASEADAGTNRKLLGIG